MRFYVGIGFFTSIETWSFQLFSLSRQQKRQFLVWFNMDYHWHHLLRKYSELGPILEESWKFFEITEEAEVMDGQIGPKSIHFTPRRSARLFEFCFWSYQVDLWQVPLFGAHLYWKGTDAQVSVKSGKTTGITGLPRYINEGTYWNAPQCTVMQRDAPWTAKYQNLIIEILNLPSQQYTKLR